MKKILITGAESYVGTSVQNYLLSKGGYQIEAVDTMGENWKGRIIARMRWCIMWRALRT